MKLAFYKGKGKFQDKVVKLATLSIYSHVELVLEDGMCVSSSKRDGGVRMKKIEMGEHWDVFELKPKYNEEAIRYWFQINDEDTYDWWGAVACGFGVGWYSDDKKYCSQVVASMLGLPTRITPGGLYRLCVKEKLIDV